jgi:hypothetical protein
MIIKREEQIRLEGLSDLLHCHSVVDNGTHWFRSGVFLAAWKLRGPDFDMFDIAESEALSQQIGRHLALGGGWTLQTDLIKSRTFEGLYQRSCNEPQKIKNRS